MDLIFLQLANSTFSNPDDSFKINALIGTSTALAIALGIVIFIMRSGKDIREWRSLAKEVSSDVVLSKNQRKTEKTIVKNIDSAKNTLNKQIGFNAFAFDLDIQWTDGSKSKVDFDKENNRVIAILQNDDTTTENFARASYFYCKRGLLPDIKKHMPRDMASSMDISLTKKIINMHRPDSIEFFEDEIVKKDHKGNKTVKEYCISLGTLDDKGQFTRVFLRELFDTGNKIKDIEPNKFISSEIQDFMDYCVKWALKKEGERNLPDFVKGKHVRFAIVPIAEVGNSSLFKVYLRDLKKSPYVRHLKGLFDQHVDSIYVLAKGHSNVEFTEKLLSYLKGYQEVLDIKIDKYSHPYDQFPSLVGHIRLKPKLE